MSNTEITNYKFTVKEGNPSKSGASDAPVWLMCEPYTKELTIVGNGFLSIRLKTDTSIEQAQEISRYLQAHVAGISHTRL